MNFALSGVTFVSENEPLHCTLSLSVCLSLCRCCKIHNAQCPSHTHCRSSTCGCGESVFSVESGITPLSFCWTSHSGIHTIQSIFEVSSQCERWLCLLCWFCVDTLFAPPLHIHVLTNDLTETACHNRWLYPPIFAHLFPRL